MRKQDIFGGLLFTFLLIGFLETAPRLFFRLIDFPSPTSLFVKDTDLGIKLKPNYQKKWIHINSLGFRGKEISLQKPPKTFRIAALGESSTFGFGDDETSPYPLQLENMLNKSKPSWCNTSFEVINAGVITYFSWQIAKHFDRDVLPLKPDAIIVYMGWNDMFSVNPDTKTTIDPNSFYNRWAEKSMTIRFLIYITYHKILPRFEKVTQKRESLYANFYPEALHKNYDAIVEHAGQHHVPVIAVTLPSFLASKNFKKNLPDYAYPYFTHNLKLLTLLWESYNRSIRDIAKQHHVFLVDLDGEFRKIKKSSKFFMDTVHANKKGNRRIAVVLADRMARENLLHCNNAAR